MRSAKTDRVTVVPRVPRGGGAGAVYVPPGYLSDVELIERMSGEAESIVAEALDRVQGVGGIVGLTVNDLEGHGLTYEGAARLAATTELSVRLARLEIGNGDALSNPEAVARYLFLRYRKPIQEVMGAVFLNQRNRVIEDRRFFVGTLTRAAVEPRPILRTGLELGAAGVILFHSHPSGKPEPSAEDIAFTRRMDDAGCVVGIQLVDHLILGSPTQWVSMKVRGW